MSYGWAGDLVGGGQVVFGGFSMVDIFSGFDSGRQAWVLTVVVVVIFSLCINVSRDYSYIS